MWYTASSGHPAGENDDRLVVVAQSEQEARSKLNSELEQIGMLEESESWVWSGAGSQKFETEQEAIDFANYRMGLED